MGVLSGAYCTVPGLDVPGLAETLELLLDMAIAVFSRCAESTSALLDALDTGQLSVFWSGMPSRCFPDQFQYTQGRVLSSCRLSRNMTSGE